MKFIDTHTHLYDEEFASDYSETIARAQRAGVQKFVLPGIDRGCFLSMMQASEKFPELCFPCAGLHPTSVKKNWQEELDFVASCLSNFKNFAAIGEIGMDAYWSKDYLAEQGLVFETQLRWSVQYDLPVIIHVRDTFNLVFEILHRLKNLPLRGVFHAFSGSIETYERIRRYGNFKIGIGGVLTYKNAGLAQVLKNIDLSDIVLETDAPWLSPVPHRGTRNESSYIPIIAQKVAELKETSLAQVAEITTRNAEQLFKFNS